MAGAWGPAAWEGGSVLNRVLGGQRLPTCVGGGGCSMLLGRRPGALSETPQGPVCTGRPGATCWLLQRLPQALPQALPMGSLLFLRQLSRWDWAQAGVPWHHREGL